MPRTACQRKCRQWLSGVGWAAFLTHHLDRLVQKRTIVIFTLSETLAFAFGCYFFIDNPRVAEMLNISFATAVLCTICIVRTFSGLLGTMAACKRKTRLTRYYYCFLLLNIVTTCALIRPLARVRCKCSSFYQCEVILSFVKDRTTPMFNPFPPPNQRKYNLGQKKRAVPYEEPPIPLAEAEEKWRRQFYQEKQGSKDTNPHARRLDEASELASRSDQSIDSFFNATSRRLVEIPQEAILQYEWFYKYFNATQRGIAWVSLSNSKPDCMKTYTTPSTDLNPFFAARIVDNFTDVMRYIKDNNRIKDDDFDRNSIAMISGFLIKCKQIQSCGGVQVIIRAETDDDGNSSVALKICHLYTPLIPRTKESLQCYPGRQGFCLNRKKDISLYFQKNAYSILMSERSSSSEQFQSDGKVFMQAVLAARRSAARNMLRRHYLASCRCRAGGHGCQSFYDSGTRSWKWWCEVSPQSEEACRRQGIKVFKDNDTKTWSEDLCKKSGCQCSYIGMMPLDGIEVNNSLLPQKLDTKRATPGLNKLAYGSSCQKWHLEDTSPWCFVGYDSVCPDREKVLAKENFSSAKWSQINAPVAQYKSTYHCVAKDESDKIKKVKDKCQLTVATPLIIFILLNIVSLPMSIIVLKFLARRCGDHFAIEAQFDAFFSSDEESGDDFEVRTPGRPSNVSHVRTTREFQLAQFNMSHQRTSQVSDVTHQISSASTYDEWGFQNQRTERFGSFESRT